MAVSSYLLSGKLRVLADVWNGASWATTTLFPPSKSSASWLHGVSCPSAEVCTAVGGYTTASSKGVVSLIESWNGAERNEPAAPSPIGGSSSSSAVGPHGVSCTLDGGCAAVGAYVNELGQEGAFSLLY